MRHLYGGGGIALIAALSATPVLSQAANFGNLTLSPGFPPGSAVVTGQTGGAYSLPSISNSDRNKKPCIGFGSETPDHIMVLERDFPKLAVQVNSRGKDTTLLIRGPGNSIVCGDDTGGRKDAIVEGNDWKAGRYEIWVGSIEARQRWNYSLTVREQLGRIR
ncbi:MAG TPA: hypothetical protein V6D35_11730 [Candidatus Sericytochromatia bacterium]|jgi:hypothetical protein